MNSFEGKCFHILLQEPYLVLIYTKSGARLAAQHVASCVAGRRGVILASECSVINEYYGRHFLF